MANNCFNHLTINGTYEEIKTIKELIRGNGELDFGDLLGEEYSYEYYVYDVEIEEDEDSGNITYKFVTKWCPPYKAFETLCERFPTLDIEATALDEGDEFVMSGRNIDGFFEHRVFDYSDIYNHDAKMNCAYLLCNDYNLDYDDYNLEEFIDDDDVVYTVEDYDYENMFDNLALAYIDTYEDVYKILQKYKLEG